MTARIDAAARSVTFLDAADDPRGGGGSRRAAAAVDEARALAERVRRKDDALRASRAYVAATADPACRAGRRAGRGSRMRGSASPGRRRRRGG